MSDNKQLIPVAKRKPPSAGRGRKKGELNKVTKEVKEMLLGALEAQGGQRYFEIQAVENPAAFMALIGKILPRDVNASIDVKGRVEIISEFPNE